MSVVLLEAATDERLSGYRVVSDPELARRTGCFVAEGRLVVERLLRSKAHRVESLLVTDATLALLADAVGTLDPAVPIYVAPHRWFETITGFHLHRGCLALARRPAPIDIDRVLPGSDLVVVLDGVTDADNVGGIFRNAAAFGAGGVILSPTTCDPLYRKAIRTSMAATLSVPFARSVRWPEDVGRIREGGFTVVALSPHARLTLDEFVRKRRTAGKVALVLGTEGAGISPGVEGEADVSLRIPMTGAVDSLNVSVACGVALSRLGHVPIGLDAAPASRPCGPRSPGVDDGKQE